MSIPAPFVPEFYLAQHTDLAGFSDVQARDHYEAYGRGEGRMASPFAVRGAVADCARQAASKLEIGPFCNPILTGDGVRYLDVLNADQLRQRASTIGLDPAGIPDRIDYVGGIDQVSERFDAVLSAHCIEHQPDLVAHLNGVAAVLNPGGRYFLIVPDKRFCFDHFIAESTVAQVVDAHEAGRRVHSLSSVVEHMALTTHNDPGRHWRGDHGPEPRSADHVSRVSAAMERFKGSKGAYIDVHAWYFTPDSLQSIVATLFQLGLTELRAAAVYDTPLNHQEFCAVLETGDSV